VHVSLVEALRPQPGERWLDLACGPGPVAELAAGAGARVTGIDLSPRLIEVARRRAAAGGFEIEYATGDCENLTAVDDGSFDVVSSSVGIMFAPDHAATAHELARVTRAGGRLGLASWTKEGGVGRMFQMMAPFQPPPPPGAGSPFGWGDETHVQELLGDAFDLSFERRVSTWAAPSGRVCWELFSTSYGPTKALAESLDPERRQELADTWSRFFDAEYAVPGGIAHDREYLLVTGTRR
jgi:ubiquinone/menaquinone biosynthesis C-methylase UbiE